MMIPLPLLTVLGLACAPKTPPEPEAPPLGWHQKEGWGGSCYFPPDYASMDTSTRKAARQESLEQMKTQWLGTREDGVAFAEGAVEDVETVLLGYPDRIEAVSFENLARCEAFMAAGASDSAEWLAWFRKLPEVLTAGECMSPLVNTYFDYLNIGGGWQLQVGMCEGEVAEITATVKDRFRIQEGGPWINVEGDPAISTVGNADYPCNIEGCFAGMLVGRFVADSGVEVIFPIGAAVDYRAPAHGTLSVRVNDTTFYDNKWFQNGAIIDRTSITVGPKQ